MNLRTYEYILAVARLGHFGKASETCHVSQPTLSMQIKKFEDYHNLKFFERDNKTVRLTPDGRTLLPYIQNIIDAEKELHTIVSSLKAPEEGEIVLGAFPTLAPFYIPRIMPLLSRALPKLKIYWVEERSPDLLDKLKNGDIDAAFLALPLDDDTGFNITPLFEESLLAAVPAQSAFAGLKEIHLKNLQDEPLLLLEDSHCLSGQALEACEWAGLKNRHDFRATSIETLRQMVGSGLGITLVPEMAVEKSTSNVRYIPLKEKTIKRTIGMVSRKTSPLSSLLDKITEIIDKK